MNVDLDSNLYILFGRRTQDSNAGSLRIHSSIPKISARKYNPVKDNDQGEASSFPKIPLIRAHGILMLIAWPLLGVSGIFFASWMRPALPKGQWFQVWSISTFLQASQHLLQGHKLYCMCLARFALNWQYCYIASICCQINGEIP